MKLSIVVIGLNEGAMLTDCLQSVRKMDFPNEDYELIYVDSSSTDDSVERAKKEGVQVLIVDDGKPNASKGRNLGWRNATGEFVLFLDGDSVLHPKFLSKALPIFNSPEVGIVFGRVREKHPNDSYYTRVHNIEWQSPIGDVSTCGGNILMRAAVLKKIEGFNESLPAGEEPEMCQRVKKAGYSIQSIGIPMVTHCIDIHTFSNYWFRCKRTGYAYACAVDLTKQTTSPLWLDRYRKNFIKTSILFIWLIIALYYLLSYGHILPLFFLITAILLLIGRTTWKTKKKGHSWTSSLYYGIHSHFQHIPMFVGQCEFLVSKIREN